MHWRVELLGELRVSCGEKVVTRLESRKVVALLARLALQPQRPHTREELADLLWPESDRETGLARLRHALSSLRRTLVPNELTGEGFFTADRQSVRVRPGSLSCDVSELERALGQKRWSVARALYKGELLPGFWDDWLCVERERLQALVENLPETQEQATPTPEPLSDSRRLRLPGYLTRFTGREVERTQLAEMLQSRRLVTLLGPGGIGKTRLATELAQAHASHFAVVAFVPLAECFDATQLQDRVRGALQLSGGERSALEQLIPYLHEQPTLLVLDNLEQLIESGGAEAIEQLLFALPSVRCIVTSRRVLDIAGEQVFPLSPLPQAQSLALFLDRAQAARPDFTLTERNRESLESLCQKLDGIPLALELAASRIRSLSVSEMQSQLSESLRLLARPNKNSRHSSLHAAIDWSWRMLSPSQQNFLAQLSVFRGGWSVEAAIVICELSDAQERLNALADASLVVHEETPTGQTRFRLLELIRAFAAEQLTEKASAAVQERHRTYYATQRPESPEEEANVLAALESACAAEDGLCAYSLFLTYATTALAHLGTPTALALGQRVLSLPAPTPREKLVALSHTVAFADTCGDTKLAQAQAQEALTLAGSEPELRAIALSIQGQLAVSNYARPTAVIPLLREALELSTQCNDITTQATILRRLGILLIRNKELAEAATCFEISETLFTSVRDLSGARYALANRAHVLGQQGDSEGSLVLYATCLERARKEGDLVHQSKLLLNIGSLQAELGQWDDALGSGQACIRVCQRIGNLRTLAFAFWNLPEPLLHLGRPETAALLMAFAETFWLARFDALGEEDYVYRDKILESSHATPQQRATGSALSLTDALALALS